MPGWLAGSALVFGSVNVTLRTELTPEMRCARALGGLRGGASKDSAMNPITASIAQMMVLFLMRARGSWFHRTVVTCLSRCQSGLSGLTCPSPIWASGSRSL